MSLTYIDPYHNNTILKETPEGLKDESDKIVFPLLSGAFRCTSKANYTDNFGFQWNRFEQTQIDVEKSGKLLLSKERFFLMTEWKPKDLAGKNILEIGSGAGRFSNVILKYTQANLFSVDYSNAVEANFRNNGENPRLKLFQANIYDLPFAPAQFDKVFCFGVLQHTPDFKKAIHSLSKMVKPGGELIVDFYPILGWWTRIQAKYLLRPFTTKMKHERLLRLIEKNIDWMISAQLFVHSIGLGKILGRFIPICDIINTFPSGMTKQERREWAILDTFDMFSPEYDNPQRLSTVKEWFNECGLQNIMAEFKKNTIGPAIPIVKGNK